MIKSTFPAAFTISDNRGDYVTYQISKNEFTFLKAFNLCENSLKKTRLIEDFSINQSSLEQVYFQFSKFQTQGENKLDE